MHSKGNEACNNERLKMTRFNEFIDKTKLYELLLRRKKYTWYRPNDTTKT